MESTYRFPTPHSFKRHIEFKGFESDGEELPRNRKKAKVINVDEDFQTQEVIVIEDDEEDEPPTMREGQGTQEDPFRFITLETGNLISHYDHGKLFSISDDESEDDANDSRRYDGRPGTARDSPSLSSQPYTSNILRRYLNVHGDGKDQDYNSGQNNKNCKIRASYMTPDIDDSHSLHDFSIQAYREDESIIEDEDEEDDDAASCILLDELTQSLEQQPWTFELKKERVDDTEMMVPDLTSSQDTVDSEDDEGPTSFRQHHSSTGLHVLNTDVGKGVDETLVLSNGNPDSLKSRSSTELVDFKEDLDSDKPLNLEERKRLFYYTHWRQRRLALEHLLERYHADLQGSRSQSNCWLYKGPLLPKPPIHTIRRGVVFKHNGRVQKLDINIVIISMLLEGLLTNEHKEGIIHNGWQASHLCGNWTCLNPRHIYPELGSINRSRNSCYRDKEGPCIHQPPCMKSFNVDVKSLRPAPIAYTSIAK